MEMKTINLEGMEETKFSKLSKLNTGSIVLLTNGQEVEFIKLKRKYFQANINGECYNIPVQMFSKLIKEKKSNDGYKKLKKGDLFMINHNGNALVFKFVKLNRKGDIVGANPISGQEANIAPILYFDKIK